MSESDTLDQGTMAVAEPVESAPKTRVRRRRTTAKKPATAKGADQVTESEEKAPAKRATTKRKTAAKKTTKAASTAKKTRVRKRSTKSVEAQDATSAETAATTSAASTVTAAATAGTVGSTKSAARTKSQKVSGKSPQKTASAEKPSSTAQKQTSDSNQKSNASEEATEGTRVRVRRHAHTQENASEQDKSEPNHDEEDSGDRRRHRSRDERENNHTHKNTHEDHSDRNDRNRRRARHQHTQNRVQTPEISEEELSKLKVADLRDKAKELELDVKGLKKAELVDAVYKAELVKEGFKQVTGILDILSDGYGFLRTQGYLPSEQDVYVAASIIRRNGLRKGDKIFGRTRPPRQNEKYPALQQIITINGHDPEQERHRKRFRDLTPIFPNERLVMEHGRKYITARVIDLAAPIGKGQRGLIVSPPKAGKTTVLKNIAASISANNPEVHLMCLLIDERPEEVTDMQRSIHGEVIASTFDMPSENHIAAAEMVIERAKRMVEDGEDVVILLDSITRLARAYNLAQPASGRVLSGGVDSAALYPPKRFLGAARNIEGGGSLSILASALVDTGSKMDEVIFEEFKGTGNMELKLDRNLADRRIFPAIDPVASGTRREDLLLDPQEAPLIWGVRRVLAGMNNTERAMTMLIKSLQQTEDNREFLIRTAKKAQQSNRYDEKFEF